MNKTFMNDAIKLSLETMRNGNGGPFGAVVVQDNKIIGKGYNCVTSAHDPTAHAEIMAIRNACQTIKHFQLTGCDLYTNCEPCPMCLGAIYWARIEKIFYGMTRFDAAEIGFDDNFIYEEMAAPISKRMVVMDQIMRNEAKVAFEEWNEKEDKVEY